VVLKKKLLEKSSLLTFFAQTDRLVQLRKLLAPLAALLPVNKQDENIKEGFLKGKLDSRGKKILNVYRNVIDRYPKQLPYEDFVTIVTESKDLPELVEKVNATLRPKTREQRSDSRAGGLRRSGDYKGKKRGEIWDILKKTNDVLSFRHKKEWARLGVKDRAAWEDLCHKLFKAICQDEVPADDWPQYTGYDMAAVRRALRDLHVLEDIMVKLHDEIEKARTKGSANNKTFLNTVREIWGDDMQVLTVGANPFKGTRKGSRISFKSIRDKNQKIEEIISSGKYQSRNTSRDYVALNTRLACVARFHVYPILFPDSVRVRKELEHVKAIIHAKMNLVKHRISPFELLGPSDLDLLRKEFTKRLAWKGVPGASPIKPLK
jgi:hypothetical protein